MRWTLIVLAILVVATCGEANASSYTVVSTNDWAWDADIPGWSYGAQDNWICERDQYVAYFEFDLSSVPDGWSIDSMTFHASIQGDDASERTLWDGATLIGQKTIPAQNYSYEAIAVDTGALNWQGADLVTLSLTGPFDFSHNCGRVRMFESDSPAYITFEATPEPAALALFGLGLTGLVIVVRRRRR